MRIYSIQIHSTGDIEKFDELYHYSDFNNMCAEFENKVAVYKADTRLIEVSYPQMDENGEVRGGFKFAKADGALIVGETCDYDVLDDE